MDFMQDIIARAKSNRQRIVLPEGTEERTLKAADRLINDGIADIILIGKPEKINLWLKNGNWQTFQRQQSLTRRIMQRKKFTPICYSNYVKRKA